MDSILRMDGPICPGVHFSPDFVTRWRNLVSRMSFAIEACAGIVDAVLSALTELKSSGLSHGVVAVDKVVKNGG